MWVLCSFRIVYRLCASRGAEGLQWHRSCCHTAGEAREMGMLGPGSLQELSKRNNSLDSGPSIPVLQGSFHPLSCLSIPDILVRGCLSSQGLRGLWVGCWTWGAVSASQERLNFSLSLLPGPELAVEIVFCGFGRRGSSGG